MKHSLLILSFAFLSIFTLSSQPKTDLRPSETVLLYADSFEGNVDPVCGKTISYAGFEMSEDNGITTPENISTRGLLKNTSSLARIDLYFPQKANGQMVIVCPGGGYSLTATYNEGLYTAEWMLAQGITVAVIKYRLPKGHYEIPSTDVRNAFKYCRGKAEEWGVKQIGIMGFSAGGHLAATASNTWTDAITRPDFSILIYPVITMEIGVTHKGTREYLIGENAIWNKGLVEKFSMEHQVTRFTPPTFIAVCADDTVVPVENSLRYYSSLIANGVEAEMHIWPSGDHGWGYSKQEYRKPGRIDPFGYARDEYNASLSRWLGQMLKRMQ